MSRYLILQADGSHIPFEGTGLLRNVEVIDAARTLTVEDSGKTFSLQASEGAAVSLPALFNGMDYKFIIGSAFATTDWTIVSTTNVVEGGAIVNSVFVPAVAENTISFVATAETKGDYVEVTSDGTSIFVNGVSALTGSITFTAP